MEELINAGTITIRIYWQDLSEGMQQRLLKALGDNCNWDVIPMTEILIENDEDAIIDSVMGDVFTPFNNRE